MPGIRVHLPRNRCSRSPESVFTMLWNGCSPSAGICVHDAPEYADHRFHALSPVSVLLPSITLRGLPGIANRHRLPLAQKSLAQKPPAQKPPAQKPPAQKPPAQKPLAQQPPAQQPLAQQPPVRQPLTQKPPAQQPLAQKPPVQKPPVRQRCLRCLLLVMCTHPFAKEAFTLHLMRSEGHERYWL